MATTTTARVDARGAFFERLHALAPARRRDDGRRRATAREVRARAEREGGGATAAKDDETGGADAAKTRARGRRARRAR